VGLNKQWGYSHLNLSWFDSNIGFYDPAFDAGGNYTDEDGNSFTDADFKRRTPAFPKQNIRHYKVGWNSNILTANGYVKVDLGYQKNQRKELEGPDPSLFFDLDTYSADVKYFLTRHEGWQPVFGVSTDAGHSTNKGEEFLIPAYDVFGLGLFGYVKRSWERSSVNFGLRYDYRSNTGKGLVDQGVRVFSPFKNNFSSLSGAVGFTHGLSDEVTVKANLGSAFRAPNPPELGSNGVHEGAFRYEVDTPDLAPEHSFQADLALEFEGKVLSGTVGVYNNYIHNYIYASHIPGDDLAVNDENGGLVDFPVYRYGQVNANLYGFEGSLVVHLADFAHLENSFGYTYAQNADFNRPLPLIPAGTLKSVLRFEQPRNGGYFYVGLEQYFRQTRIDPAFETTTDSYALLNAGIGKSFKLGRQQLKIQVSGTNLANKKYYSALSRLKPGRLDQNDPSLGVYDPGRSFIAGIYLPFSF
jgi:iron complex outermembrane receptor protein